MTDDGSARLNAVRPIQKFRFEVLWGDAVMSFQEVSGLDVESQLLEYRRGGRPSFSAIKMPGLNKSGSITMKRGVFKSDNQFWTWFNEIKTNTSKRTPVTIRLLDEAGAPTMVWTLASAWPAKVTGPDLKAEGNEVAVESLEIGHEGLTIANS
jgi:phage tail-like protein